MTAAPVKQDAATFARSLLTLRLIPEAVEKSSHSDRSVITDQSVVTGYVPDLINCGTLRREEK